MTRTWTDADFHALSWHDVHVHGLRVLDGEHGAGELWLDIDYILEWVRPNDAECGYRFRIAAALLRFHDVTSLQLSLDYATPGAAMGPFSLEGIQRDSISYGAGHTSYRWTLAINWPAGAITFESPSFTQTLTGPEVETDSQQLEGVERSSRSPAE